MNRVQKRALSQIRKVENLAADLEDILEDLQSYFDERSESWQESERGEEFSDHLYNLEELKDTLENAAMDARDNLDLNDED